MSSVDTGIDPHPTGAAAALAAAHAAPHSLKLYGAWFCPFVQRVWITLAEKNIHYQYIEINPYVKEPHFMALNPHGLVPTLAIPATVTPDGKEHALYESNVVCQYLDEEFSDVNGSHSPSLFPHNAFERARCRLWIEHISNKIVPVWYRLMQHQPHSSYTSDEAMAAWKKGLIPLVKEMAPIQKGPWFLGEKFSMVDICLAPWAARLWLLEHYKQNMRGLHLEDESENNDDSWVYARWKAWLDAVINRKSVIATLSEKDMYVDVYRRYAEDKTQSEVGQATRKGERLP